MPAPGVPPIRVVNTILDEGPVATMTVDRCAADCVSRGYYYAGLTGHVGHYYCYCSCSLNPAAPPEPKNSTCTALGGDGAMAAYGPITCSPAAPPSHKCGPPQPPLPPGPACSQAASHAFGFCNTSLSLEERVADLVGRLSVEEAGALLTARESPEIPRLGIPAFYWGTNALHGVQWGNATSFPQTISLASTWNRTVWRLVGRVVGREMRALHNIGTPNVGLTSWSPVINVQRDPRWGRSQETPSEDPFLNGAYGAEWSLGMQYDRHSDDSGKPPTPRSAGLLAVTTLKHVLAYSLDYYSSDGNMSHISDRRSTFNARVSPYDLADTYTRPFRDSIVEGGAAGVMYACNEVNGIPAVASKDLAASLHSWGFDGYRTTDGDGVGGLYDRKRQHYVSNATAAVAVALADGESDIDDGGTYQAHLADAYASGAVSLATIRRALSNIFRIQFRLGLFDPPAGQPWRKLGMDDVDTPASRHLNVEAARQSLVLLQNRLQTLPFAASSSMGPSKVVVVGPSGNSTRLLGGGHYARPMAIVDGFENDGIPGIPGAIRHTLGDTASVEWFPGIKCSPRPDQVCVDPKYDAALEKAALAAVEDATHVVLVLGLQSSAPCDSAQAYRDGGNQFNPCGYESEQHDRTRLTLPKIQQDLGKAVLAAAKKHKVPAAVVLVHGGTLAVEGLKADADAILDAHYPGEVTGAQAIADALWGRFSPAGKLTHSFMPAVYSNLSNFASMSMTDPPGRTYRYYPTSAELPPPLWKFGAGLTYTTWRFSLEGPSAERLPASWTLRVTNTGKMDSDEVVQVFFVPMFTRSGCPTPHRQLIDFERIHVNAGSSVSVPFHVQQLELVALDGSKSQVPGNYTIIFTNGEDATVSVPIVVDAKEG